MCLYNYFLSINFQNWNCWVKELARFSQHVDGCPPQQLCPRILPTRCESPHLPIILTSTGIIFFHQTINKEVKSSAPLLCAKCHLKAFREL